MYFSLAKTAAPGKPTISVSLKGTSIANEWEIWVYPPKVNVEPPKGLVVGKFWNHEVKATLGHGGRVLLFATANRSQSLPGRFLPVFWSPIWFSSQKPNTMGVLCDPKHPALADFPTDFYTTGSGGSFSTIRGASSSTTRRPNSARSCR